MPGNSDQYRRQLHPSADAIAQSRRFWSAISGYAVDDEQAAWELRNFEAIRMLRDAERFQCRHRTRALIEEVHNLDERALPADFFRRLVTLQAKHFRAGRSKKTAIEIHERARLLYRSFREMLGVGYDGAIVRVAQILGRSEKAIEGIVSKPSEAEPVPDADEDFERFEAERLRRYPKSRGPFAG